MGSVPSRKRRLFHTITAGVMSIMIGTTHLGEGDIAFAQGVVTTAIGGIVGKKLLDEAEQKARDSLQVAESSGDYLLWQFATNMLRLIEQTRKDASGLLDKTIDGIGEQRNQAFYQINELMATAETNLQAAYLKADELTANFAEIVNTIPLIGKDSADLFAIQPVGLPPVDTERIVRFLGPGMGKAEAVATLPNGKVVPLTAEKATSAYLKLRPLDFASADGMPNFVEIKVEYIKSRASWFCFFCSDEKTTRTIPFVVPPRVPGKVRLIHTMETSEAVRNSYLVVLNTAGKRINIGHPVNVPPNYLKEGYEIEASTVIAAMQPGGNRLITRAWGYSGSCNGVNISTLRSDGFIFDVYAGATCNLGGCKGGNQSCEIRVPLVKTVVNKTESAGEFQSLDWKEPAVLTPDPSAKSVEIELEKPDGSRVRFPPGERILAVTVTTEAATGAFRILPFMGTARTQ